MTPKNRPNDPAPPDPADDGAPLPHDRDENPAPPRDDGQTHANRAPIRQAHVDVESGLQDTERIGTPSDVPSSTDNRRGKK